MLVEALILDRLATLPKRRHPDWIRSLLVQGFLAERRVDRRLSATKSDTAVGRRQVPNTPRAGFTFGDWVSRSTRPQPMAGTDREAPQTVRQCPVRPDAGDRPFAHLRRVVG